MDNQTIENTTALQLKELWTQFKIWIYSLEKLKESNLGWFSYNHQTETIGELLFLFCFSDDSLHTGKINIQNTS